MRKSTRFCIFLVSSLLLSTSLVYSQFGSTVVQFTNGNSDYNPRFSYKYGSYFDYGYFVFERHFTGNVSNICIDRFNGHGSFDEVFTLSSGPYNFNPNIGYNGKNWQDVAPKYILTLWESHINDSVFIAGRQYTESSQWSNEFFVDSSITINTPEILCLDSTNFTLVYEKDGDIIFRTYDAISNQLSIPFNLTGEDSTQCKNPYFGLSEDSILVVSYEKIISSTKTIVCYKTKFTATNTWSNEKILTSHGTNTNYGFTMGCIYDLSLVYQQTSSNVSGIYLKNMILDSVSNDSVFIIDNVSSDSAYSFTGGYPYIITDRGCEPTNIGLISSDFFDRQTAFFYNFLPTSNPPWVSVELNTDFFDPLDVSLTSSSKVPQIHPGLHCTVNWFLFNKRSAQYESRIFGIDMGTCFEVSITPISSEIPNSFALKQNYPNPFNPSTKIRFDIPRQSGNVKLSVFNTVGQEVAVLINEQLQPGVYEYDFNAGGYPSGVYYYRLQAGEYSETKRMVLVK